MAAPTAISPAPAASPGAAYVVDATLVGPIHALLTQIGVHVQAVKVSPEQLPRFNVLPSGVRIANLEHARRMKLTDREFEVLTLIAEGLSNREIGQQLYLTEDTVKTHIRRMFQKFGVGDRAHAVAVGYQRGILGGS
ncbi:response regulator transcription factor [Amycolatopsis plumensis]|uniref:Response regulator transcription factor n=1 Tax=Amycolatopsis plumensis TaxID=236508 RepID=A0ABV5U8S8_9PSEU